LSRERIIKALEGLGLSQDDILVYVFLAKNGSHEERAITEMLGFHVRQTICSLKNLQEIDIVKSIGEDPVHYSAKSFEEVIELFIEVKREQVKTMKESREELLSSWKILTQKE
jgi:sugar-specific transcriptional regulator TrmB